MGAPTIMMNASPPPVMKPNVFQKLFQKRGRKAKHHEPLKVASAMPPPPANNNTTTTTKKTNLFWGNSNNNRNTSGGTSSQSRNNSNNKSTDGRKPETTKPIDPHGTGTGKKNNPSSGRNEEERDRTATDLSSYHRPSSVSPEETTKNVPSAQEDEDECSSFIPNAEVESTVLRRAAAGFHDPTTTSLSSLNMEQLPSSSSSPELELSFSAQRRLIKERDGFCRRVNRYDGSVIHVEGIASYELGNYLGGGVAGVVYEGQRLLPEAAYPVRRGLEQPTPEIDPLLMMISSTQQHNNNKTSIIASPGIMDYVSVPNHLLCQGGGTTTAVDPPIAPTSVISITPGDLHLLTREGSMLTTESFANPKSVAGNSVALEADGTAILIDDQDAPSRSKQMAESLRHQQLTSQGLVNTSFQEAFMEEKVAIKILNPVGFRALALEVTESAVVARPGLPLSRDIRNGKAPMTEDHVWWLVNPSSRNLRTLQKYPDANSTPRGVEVDRGNPERGLRISLIAAYKDPHNHHKLKELPLNRCIEIWGHVPFDTSDVEFRRIMHSIDQINQGLPPPSSLPPDRVATATSSMMEETSMDDHKSNLKFAKPPPSPLMAKRTGILKAATTPRKTAYCAELNAYIAIPSVPSKFLKWLRQRRAATKEIRNMMLIGRHRNVVHLFEVLELIQETKSTMFLVLELVKGGELFDLISNNNTSRLPPVHQIPPGFTAAETAMRKFFYELASGIHYCHANHIAHRDLKPENLLVHNNDDGTCTLKIADFGLSAVISEDVDSNNNDSDTATFSSQLSSPPILSKQQQQQRSVTPPQQQPISPIKQQMDKLLMAGGAALGFFTCGAVDNIIDCNTSDPTGATNFTLQHPSPFRRMTSVVGSPHYVAPEIISQQDRKKKKELGEQRKGYDGTKADVWSAGVILYAMLFRSLPFGEDLLRCPRYQSFKKWYDDIKATSSSKSRRRDLYAALNPVITESDAQEQLGPLWFFPNDSSPEARDLVIYMLNPDPDQRPSIQLVLQHPWLLKEATI